MKGRVLVVDDDQAMCNLLEVGLRRRGYDARAHSDPREAVHLLEQPFDVLVTDLHMAGMDGLDLAREAMSSQPGLPVIVITAFGDIESAVTAVRAGAYDFIAKPFELEVLSIALDRAIAHKQVSTEVCRLRERVESRGRFGKIIGESEAMERIFDILERVADSEATVLITGESGTGKELVARALHDGSRRRDGPFIAVNCAALPEPLLESELFGHAKGAFTGARGARPGLFLRSHGGTLFLDEIGEMAAGVQAKLLRALQEMAVRPVGADEEVPFDARIIAATNRDIEAEVEEGRFREDLFFRLNVIQLEMPPLRARGGDVLLLANHLIDSSAAAQEKGVVRMSPDAERQLAAYAWPGNVRELQNCIERAVVLARSEQIGVDDLPDRVRAVDTPDSLVETDGAGNLVTLEEVERRYVLRVLEAVKGEKAAAARILGLDRKTLYRKLARWGSAS